MPGWRCLAACSRRCRPLPCCPCSPHTPLSWQVRAHPPLVAIAALVLPSLHNTPAMLPAAVQSRPTLGDTAAQLTLDHACLPPARAPPSVPPQAPTWRLRWHLGPLTRQCMSRSWPRSTWSASWQPAVPAVPPAVPPAVQPAVQPAVPPAVPAAPSKLQAQRLRRRQEHLQQGRGSQRRLCPSILS